MPRILMAAILSFLILPKSSAAEPTALTTQPARTMQILVLAADSKAPIEKASLSILTRGGGKDQKLSTDAEGKCTATVPSAGTLEDMSILAKFDGRVPMRAQWQKLDDD